MPSAACASAKSRGNSWRRVRTAEFGSANTATRGPAATATRCARRVHCTQRGLHSGPLIDEHHGVGHLGEQLDVFRRVDRSDLLEQTEGALEVGSASSNASSATASYPAFLEYSMAFGAPTSGSACPKWWASTAADRSRIGRFLDRGTDASMESYAVRGLQLGVERLLDERM